MRRPPLIAFAAAAALAGAIAYSVWHVPVQVDDSLGEIIAAQATPSVSAAFAGSLRTSGYLRPLRIAQIKLLHDAAGGSRYQLAYRGFHVVLVVALVALFVSVLRVETSTDAAAALFALVVLTGLHTFIGFIREAFPINHFLEIAVMCVAALRLAQSRGGRLADAAACALLVAAVLTLESGVLVWVTAAAAWLVGYRGVSRRGVVVMTMLLAGYFVLRFGFLSTGVPALAERASGFLLERLEPAELQRRFGDGPLPFYAYNVAASVASVLFSEPRDGLFSGVKAWLDGDVAPRFYLWIVSSIATTGLIAWAGVSCWRRRAAGEDGARLMGVAVLVILGNAVLSFAYTKDEIVAVAGVFYAMAAYAAVRAFIGRLEGWRPLAVVIPALALLALSSAWTVRSAAVHHVLRHQAFRIQGDWAELPARLRREGRWADDAMAQATIGRLRDEALAPHRPNPLLVTAAYDRWFGD